jgi:C1A family cysteine protease
MRIQAIGLSVFLLAFSAASTATAQIPPAPASPAIPVTAQMQSTLNALRSQAQAQNWAFSPQITGASVRPLKSLTGENPPTPAQQVSAPALNKQANFVIQLFNESLKFQGVETAQPSCDPHAGKMDWRAYGKVTKPKFQQCGDCWAFASAGQIESAFLMAGWQESDLAEQSILDCSNSGDCDGGTRWSALPWATTTSVADETAYPSAGGVKNAVCKAHAAGTHKLLAADWIDSSGNVTDTAQLKQAICQYGPISVSIFASPALTHYRGPAGAVFDENNNANGTNHAILLIGWDDEKQAWLIKNSWGPDWGFDQGFGLIRYGSNNIGRWPFWAKAPPPNFNIPAQLKFEIDKLHALIPTE